MCSVSQVAHYGHSLKNGENATKLLFNSGLGNKIILLPLFLSFFFFFLKFVTQPISV